MTLAAEFARSVRGAFRIALMDPDAPACFNLSIEGFWRSFLAPILLSPLYLAVVLPDGGGAEGEAGPAAPAVARIASLALSLIAFPLLMIPISHLLKLGGQYVSYIIMWNWSAVPQAAVMLPVAVALNHLAPSTGGVLFMSAIVTVLFYGYLVARAGLRCPPATAAGVVALDLVLSLLVNAATRSAFA